MVSRSDISERVAIAMLDSFKGEEGDMLKHILKRLRHQLPNADYVTITVTEWKQEEEYNDQEH